MVEPAENKARFKTLAALYDDMERSEARTGFSQRMVPGEGPIGATMMLVGEQPGDREDQMGRPFVGPAGRVLDKCLADAGIDRSMVFLTNAVKRFKFEQRGKRRLHQTPTAGDIAHERWWLQEEIRLVGPKIVVALGGTALRALTDRRALGPIRGQILSCGDHRLLATVHPSYLLRLRNEPKQSEEQASFQHDLEKAALAVRES